MIIVTIVIVGIIIIIMIIIIITVIIIIVIIVRVVVIIMIIIIMITVRVVIIMIRWAVRYTNTCNFKKNIEWPVFSISQIPRGSSQGLHFPLRVIPIWWTEIKWKKEDGDDKKR